MKKILVIEDDPNIRTILGYDLMKSGYTIEEAQTGKEGLEKALNQGPWDLILIDWMLPEMTGIEIIKECRKSNIDSILFMLTARISEEDMIEAFEAGADDFMYKPFSIKVLHLRIEAHLKRKNTSSNNIHQFMDISINTKKRIATIKNHPIRLTKKEFDFLEYFILHNNEVLSRDQILNDLWGFDYDEDTRIVDVHIYKLRNKLKNSQAGIHSSRGIGYILERN